MDTDLSLLRLLQLVSPGLPIGMYSYSQGMESAVNDGWIVTVDDAENWLNGLLSEGLARVDAPILARLYDAWSDNDAEAVKHWSQHLIACRETGELRSEDRQTGQALARLLDKLEISEAQAWLRRPDATLATLFSLAAVRWQISKTDAIAGYLWGWLENQVLCAVKLVPLGQVAGQQLLKKLAGKLPVLVQQALALSDDEIGGSVFGLALASSRHEMQYSRLFRS
ncbi:MAG: urease accessory protein UreF [Methylococcaceae bacterium]|nr:urease accessory protein UreF [Methylococcaceae bacterium]MDZ4157412.1 urease accessory protein UreF [Methylococcales bacterium]MDP2393673.1 urease accessory protein UreF [Methylococcaceae bacterium]MDP3020691.1 urease accessory protein UreF [Methylococcaceae bacterium]MDP3390438.1 urease accessory protein UreF [Methylococcaceae bacterium]